jgi:hypothetical protein
VVHRHELTFLGCGLVCLLCRQAGGESEVMLLSIDGMDQAKTVLPHEQRSSKDTDGMYGLPVHVVSAFVFGGLKPIIGFLNLPDISKNGSLTVANIHRAIQLQFLAHLEKHGGNLVSWPKRLHVCFDNAVGENLNSFVFAYLAALVHCGIFLSVTVGTLIVGHTHNINDQLFSVWSRWLAVNNCMTVNEMMKAFNERYRGRVKETPEEKETRLEKEKAPTIPERSDSVPATGSVGQMSDYLHIRNELPPKMKAEMKSSSLKIQQDINDAAAIAQPYMELVKKNVDVAGWVTTDLLVKRPNVFSGISKYHVFAFAKDAEGRTGMYNKFVVNAELQYHNKPHEYVFDGVRYRGYRVVFEKDDVIDRDPIAFPSNPFNTTSLKQLIAQLKAEDGLTPVQVRELEDTCKMLEDQVTQQGSACAKCKVTLEALAKIGPLKRPLKTDDAAKKHAYAANQKMRSSLRAELVKHLGDPNQAANHAVMEGWWTEWINIRVPMITEHYRSRGLLSAEPVPSRAQLTGLLAHPEDQTEDERLATGRVDAECMANRGPPLPGMYVIARGDRSPNTPPFWIGKIVKYFTPSGAELEHARLCEEVVAWRLLNPTKRTDPRYKMPPSPKTDSESTEVQEPSLPQGGYKKSGAKDTLETQHSKDNIFAHTHLVVKWYDHQEPTVPKKRRVAAEPSAAAQPAAASRPRASKKTVNYAERDEDEAKERESDSEVKDSAVSKKRKRRSKDSSDSELGVDMEDDTVPLVEVANAVMAKAMVAAMAAPKNSVVSKKHKGETTTSSDAMDMDDDNVPLAAVADAVVRQERKRKLTSAGEEAGTRDAKISKRDPATADASVDTLDVDAAPAARTLSGPIPPAQLARWRDLVYLPSDLDPAMISVATVIWWDFNIFNDTRHRLEEDVWKQVVKDLGQDRDV